MNKIMGSAFLVAGTAIGAGMIALPIALGKLGVGFSLLLMVVVWLSMYYAAMINTELNLRAGQGLPLGALGTFYGSSLCAIMGGISLTVLAYSLIAAYINAGASIFQSLIYSSIGTNFNLEDIAIIWAAILALILAMPIRLVDLVNRFLFVGLIALIFFLIVFLIINSDISNLELYPAKAFELNSWQIAAPIVFTSFGFQIVCHTLANYCNNDAKVLKKAFLFGSVITLSVYVLWIIGVLAALSSRCPEFYQKLTTGSIEIGELITNLSRVTNISYMQNLIWMISALAIVTSAIGVGLGLLTIWQKELLKIKGLDKKFYRVSAIALTILPSLLVAVIIPNAFIKALNFAGMMMVFQAIFIPLYLLRLADISDDQYFYPLLKNNIFKILLITFGMLVLICEFINILK